MAIQETRKGVLTRHQIWQYVDLGLQPPQLWEINVCCLSHPACGILLEQFKLTKIPSRGSPFLLLPPRFCLLPRMHLSLEVWCLVLSPWVLCPFFSQLPLLFLQDSPQTLLHRGFHDFFRPAPGVCWPGGAQWVPPYISFHEVAQRGEEGSEGEGWD